MHADKFRRCLEDCDVAAIRRLWAHVSPHLPQPKSDAEALTTIHIARTATNSIAFKLRAYSHSWLRERHLPSQLPDNLKQSAERLYPRIVDAVGVSVKALSERQAPYAKAMERAMSDAVAEAYADGNKDPVFVRARMNDARDKFIRGA